ncbi:MAG: hypothetical protein AB1Z67_14135 [Candidatus Limnocylindrales bacterium]
MIRNVVLHLHNELPMKADVESLPTAADAGLLCTNLRTLEGRKPLSTEFLDSVFLIPYNVIRFIEIPRAAIHEAGIDQDLPGPAELPASASAVHDGTNVIVTPAPGGGEAGIGEEDESLAMDEELLRRIREA